jgi:hypothetical protein
VAGYLRMMKLQFKFREGTVEAARRKVISALAARGARGVRPLFPGERDKELATLYVVECKDPASGEQLLKLLNASRAVEFAEVELRRKLIR